MHVDVDDRDARDAELGLRVPGGDCDVVEDAEPHPALPESVMPGRAHEREPASLRGLDRAAGGERRRLPRRRTCIRVRIEHDVDIAGLDRAHVLLRVHPLELLTRGGPALGEPGETLVQDGEPLRQLDMIVVRSMERGQSRMPDQLHVAASANLPARPSMPSSRA
jgi:hypothetical protein